jgi:orotidine-5'-phosphate decarboxylase
VKKLPVILAVDTKEVQIAERLISSVANQIDHIKLGLEFYLANGANAVLQLQQKYQFELFLDLKLHDIPNTVEKAVQSISHLKPKFLTVHAQGGAAMISAAAKALPDGNITAVTILTSISDVEFEKLGYQKNISAVTNQLVKISSAAGAKAIVCSPLEVGEIAKDFPNLIRITPGVRLADDPKSDQARTLTPKEAISQGANYLVIGRPITSLLNKFTDPNLFKAAIAEKLDSIADQCH